MSRRTRYAAFVLALLLAAVAFLWLKYPATLRNVYEDSWWLETTQGWDTHTAWPEFDSRRETLYRMEQMADAREWRDLCDLARKTMNDNMRSTVEEDRALAALAMRYALLAESCQGTLAANFRSYPVHSPEDFVMFRDLTRDACVFNMYFFRELGLPDEVFHQAMQYPLSFAPCTHRSLRMMTEAAQQSGDMAVARKLARVSGHPIPTADDACGGGSVADVPLRSRVFVFGDPMVRVFLTMLNEDMTNRRLFDYAALSFIVMGQRDKLQQLMQLCPIYNERNLPYIYRQ